MNLPVLLALDTSNQHCSVALKTASGEVFSRHVRAEQSHSQVVLPLVRELLDEAKCALSDLDAVVVGLGPGGFTGVRLAVAVAQGLAFAVDKPVIGLSSLDALAYAAAQSGAGASTIVVAMDARMQQVYWAQYAWDGAVLRCTHAPAVDDADVVLQALMRSGETYDLVGNAWSLCAPLPDAVVELGALATVDHDAPHVADLLDLAAQRWHAGAALPAEAIVPLYVRDKVALTMAEREAGARL